MNEEFKKLRKDILSLACKDNLVAVIVYGSYLENNNIKNDLDIIIIVRIVGSNLNPLFELFAQKYKNLDFNVYSEKEIIDGLSFYTREFKLEYLAKGLCIYGENILKIEFAKIDNFQYRQSILIRSIEHLQIIRQKYFSNLLSREQKFYFLKKYFFRISKNILLFKGIENHSSVNNLKKNEVIKKLVAINMFDFMPNIHDIKTLDEYFDLFSIVSEALVRCKRELNLD